MFSCEIYENFKNNYFEEHLRTTASTPTQVFSCEIYESFNNTYFEEHLWTTASI